MSASLGNDPGEARCPECGYKRPDGLHASWCSSPYRTSRFTLPWPVTALLVGLLLMAWLKGGF